jgi:phage baseplate assembly protein gpV
VVDTRRIRQENIELLARSKATIEAPSIHLRGETKITGNEQVTGNVIVGSGATGVFSNVFGENANHSRWHCDSNFIKF